MKKMKKLIVYFEDCRAVKHPIGEVKDKSEAWTVINTFLVKHRYHAPYIREWDDGNQHWYDVGSHSEFFYTEEIDK